jgi:alpha-N-arabinofuranosidase
MNPLNILNSPKSPIPVLLTGLLLFFFSTALAQPHHTRGAEKNTAGKAISPDLFGVFFEDLSYAADGGLYAELIQNRSFEYNPGDHKGWDALTSWDYTTEGYGYGSISVETRFPLSAQNPHYVVLNVDEAGSGVGLTNSGFDGIAVKAGEQYEFSVFLKQFSNPGIPVEVRLQSKGGVVYGRLDLKTESREWKQYGAAITSDATDDNAVLVIVVKKKGILGLDMVSLFPQKTFHNRKNGLRADLGQVIAGLKPKFVRFPGGCLTHGDGLNNIYRWKNTIGPVERRVEQRNIWNYHQSMGLGYFEYFQFCEDIGAKPVPVVAAGVSCQNSGGSWRIGSTGQRALSLEAMKGYVQDILDLVEYANGSAATKWGAKRAAAGHPKPFNLEYLGIGNEDKITPEFRERFRLIYDAIKKKYPAITLIGTVGPDPSGAEYDRGWAFARQLAIPVVDEHYYQKPDWFLNNNLRYDAYARSGTKVYIGEYASWGNELANALAEASYMTSLERNGDVVRMASYAPLLARQGNTSWNPNLIYFTNTKVCPTVNYYVQQLFSCNQGDRYFDHIVSFIGGNVLKDSSLAASCVRDSKTGDIILKVVNCRPSSAKAEASLTRFGMINSKAKLLVLRGKPSDQNTMDDPGNCLPSTADFTAKEQVSYEAPPYSLSIIRIKTSASGNQDKR